MDRTELYLSEEVLLANTAKVIRPVREIDHYVIGDGSIGKVTQQLWSTFTKVARREVQAQESWYSNSLLI